MQLQHSKITKNSVILSAVKILKLINLKETIDPADTQASWNSPAAPVNQTNHGRSNQGNNRIFSKLDLVLKDKGGKKKHAHTHTHMHARIHTMPTPAKILPPHLDSHQYIELS